MTKLRLDAEKTPLSHIIIITLFAVGGVAIPLDYIFELFIVDKLTVTLLSQITIRVILSVIALVFVFKYGYHKAFVGKNKLISLVAVVPALLVAINNFPLVGLISGSVVVTASATNVGLFVLFCLTVGVYEEVVFRGLILPLTFKLLEKVKNGTFWAVALSSAIFGASHLMGLFSGNIGGTFLQVGYSFLIGAMCAISLIITKNLFVAIVLHFVYDVGGLMTTYIAIGNQWDTLTIIITAVLGVIVLLYMLFALLKSNYTSVKNLYYPSDFNEEITEN